MLLNYYKGEPNSYILAYQNGQIKKQGIGKTFFYLPYNTTLASVPIMTQGAQFIFKEVTANYQEVSLQGQVTYRIAEPLKTAALLDFSINPKNGKYQGDDPEKLIQRIVNTVQSYARTAINRRDLEQALCNVKEIETEILCNAQGENKMGAFGVEVEGLYITTIKATPELQKALEADYRETIQKRADHAIYDRRWAAQEEEDKLRKNEMETDVALENRRIELVDTQARNNLALAEADAKAEEMLLNPYSNMEPQALVALALKEWAKHAGTIGNLNISPDLLGQISHWIANGQKETVNNA